MKIVSFLITLLSLLLIMLLAFLYLSDRTQLDETQKMLLVTTLFIGFFIFLLSLFGTLKKNGRKGTPADFVPPPVIPPMA